MLIYNKIRVCYIHKQINENASIVTIVNCHQIILN